jgi:FtsH-binding integral membrane protein
MESALSVERCLIANADKKVLAAFARRLWACLAVHLLALSAVAAALWAWREQLRWAEPALQLVCVLGGVVLLCAYCCEEPARRRGRMLLFVLAMSGAAPLGLAALHGCGLPTLSAALVASVVLGLAIVAVCARIPLLGAQPHLVALAVCLFLPSYALIDEAPLDLWSAGVASLAALLVSLYVILHIQFLLRGKRRRQFYVEEYGYAALSVYISFFDLFSALFYLGERY